MEDNIIKLYTFIIHRRYILPLIGHDFALRYFYIIHEIW